MKTHTESWRILYKKMEDTILHANREGLPLKSIELTPGEWDDFVIARTTLVSGKRLDTSEFDGGTAMWMHTKIFRGS